jgi:single-strand selective monofunctional uracil DNA glycosylase
MNEAIQISRRLSRAVEKQRFGAPVTHVYNPLVYAQTCHEDFLELFGQAPKEIILLGMNPGPWGMVQTGVPFGEIATVREWLGLENPVKCLPLIHPKRPIQGFDCQRSEVSGRRLWGWVRESFGTPKQFFRRWMVLNYCPLAFLEASGRNRTPDKLPQEERKNLFEACDTALRNYVDLYQPRWVIGVGAFARKRAESALADTDVQIAGVLHPSPASPAANRGWAQAAQKQLYDLGIEW